MTLEKYEETGRDGTPCPVCGNPATRVFIAAPGIRGHKRGPGSGSTESVFERPDTLKEVTRCAKLMEEKGRLRNNPAMTAQLQSQIKHLKNLPESKRTNDYDKNGHPLDN